MVTRLLGCFRRKSFDGLVLNFLWFMGLIFGGLLSSGCVSLFSNWMRAAYFADVSIVWLFAALLLPFLLSSLAVYFHQKWLLLPLAFLKAFLFGFSFCGIGSCCGRAGWLVCLLLFFSEIILFPLLFFFLKRCFFRFSVFSFSELSVYAAFVFLVASFDRCVISPFLASLI